MRILVTGGTGFVGSHVTVALIEAGHEPVLVDNLSNSKESVLDRIARITGYRPELHVTSVGDRDGFASSLGSDGVEAVIHMAALKAVGESVEQPLRYYDNNVGDTVRMLGLLAEFGVRNVVFSSSATVYGEPRSLPLTESMPTGRATNPYGWTKLVMEQVMTDLASSDPAWSMTLLRYFNPVGAHPSSEIGEDPANPPTNLMPIVCEVAAERRPRLGVFGTDYPTRDGTPVRDYVHVMDVAEGHVAAVERLSGRSGVHIFNLGSGRGTTVLELVENFTVTNQVAVPWEGQPRRPGDVAETWASVDKAKAELGWVARRDLSEMSRDSWNWQQSPASGGARH